MVDDPMTDALGVNARSQARQGSMLYFAILSVALLYAALELVRPFVTAILIAIVLVFLTFPIYARLRERCMAGRAGPR